MVRPITEDPEIDLKLEPVLIDFIETIPLCWKVDSHY